MAENPDKGEFKCPNCDTKNKDGRTYCSVCGWILTASKKADC
jgi:uncharacterized Zn finger protein (UPF0148 family)